MSSGVLRLCVADGVPTAVPDVTVLVFGCAGGYVRREGRHVDIAYIKSDFTGQLPQPFVTTAHQSANFNDANAEEPSRYVRVCVPIPVHAGRRLLADCAAV